MNKMILSAALLAVGSFAALAPAEAANRNYRQQDQYISNYCQQHPYASECRDWKMNHNNWNNSQYQGFYHNHRHDRGFGDNSVAALFGFFAGAAIASSAQGNYDGHVQACQQRYRSYDVRSDSFLGYDGYRHDCTL